MSWWQPHKFEAKRAYLLQRMALIKAVRAYFDGQEFCEVETPILQVMPSADLHVHGVRVDVHAPDLQTRRELYLQTSPEFAMKKLMVAGVPQLYQMCKVFRNGDDSARHSPEFTMLEWYRAGVDYTAIMEDCKGLLRQCADVYRYKGQVCDPHKEWQHIRVAEAFELMAGISLADHLGDVNSFAASIKSKGIRVAEGDSWDDLFFRVMAEKIEPHLGVGAPAILYEYPASMASLSRRKPSDPRFAERFELYVCGVELANAFTELTDAQEQRRRFVDEMAAKQQLYGVSYPLDEDFLAALAYGLPDCAGIALGIDRLAMLASGAEHIEQVLWAGKP